MVSQPSTHLTKWVPTTAHQLVYFSNIQSTHYNLSVVSNSLSYCSRVDPTLPSTHCLHPHPGVSSQTGGASEVSRFGAVMAHLLRPTNRFTFGPNRPRFGPAPYTRDFSKRSSISLARLSWTNCISLQQRSRPMILYFLRFQESLRYHPSRESS